MKYLVTLTIALCTSIATAAAQAPSGPDGGWTLEECMLWAVEHSPETNIQQARNDMAKEDYREAIGRLLPRLGASAGADFSFGRGLDPNTNTYTDRNSFGSSFGASSSLVVFDGLSGINRIRLARINRITGGHALQQRRDEVAFATMEAFFNVLYYKKMVVLAESQLEESRLNLRQTERMEELGIKGFPDVAEMKAQEAANAYELTRQRNLLAIGVILLKERMNFPVEASLDTAPFDLGGEVVKTPQTAGELYARALASLPKARAASSSAEASRVALQIARGARWPDLSLRAGYSTGFARNLDGSEYESFANQFRNKRGYYVGASLSIPIFNGFSTSAGINRSKHQLSIAQTERDATLRALYTEIEQAVADMNGSADQHEQAVRQSEFTSVAHEVNQRKYDEGLVSALELHTSSNRLVKARADELYSRLQYIIKKRWVDYYSGIPLVEPESEK